MLLLPKVSCPMFPSVSHARPHFNAYGYNEHTHTHTHIKWNGATKQANCNCLNFPILLLWHPNVLTVPVCDEVPSWLGL